MVKVTVDATWRLSRVEFHMPATTENGVVNGFGEVLLKNGDKSYGKMPGDTIMRPLGDVMKDVVELDGKPIEFSTVLVALGTFMEKWRLEDEVNPPVGRATEPVTVDGTPPNPPMREDLPPPIDV